MSIIWTLRKYIDGDKRREEEAAQERDRKHARRQGLGDGDDDPPGGEPQPAAKLYACRVCGHRSADDAYCPQCLADTMVEVPPPSPTTDADPK
jgi:rubrerythrin